MTQCIRELQHSYNSWSDDQARHIYVLTRLLVVQSEFLYPKNPGIQTSEVNKKIAEERVPQVPPSHLY
jgi:hypothetical protein